MSSKNVLPHETSLYVKDHCLCLHVQRAARALGRRLDDALRRFDLTNGQFSLLMSLNRPQPPRMTDVAELLAMDRTTLTAALKPLERRGLVKIAAGRDDRRSRLLALTANGCKLLARAVPVWQEAHAAIEAQLSEGSGDRLRAELRVLSAKIAIM